MPSRTVRWSVSAAVLVAAGMALTACGPDDTTSDPSPSASASTGQSGPAPASSAGGTSGGSAATSSPTASAQGSNSGGGSAKSNVCQAANLSFSNSHGMGEGELMINLKNSGSSSCTMHGFPGVDLKGQDGTVSASRSAKSAPTVTLAPGQTAYVALHYPPNNSGGTGVTFTSLVVTPPNTYTSHTLPVGINVPVGESATPTITVDPVSPSK